MGRVRTMTVKKSSRQVIERYYSTMTLDFHTNKKILEEVAIMPSRRLSNKIARFSTHLMERIQKGPVRGISLKLQEEEREMRMDFVPEESAIKINEIKVEKETLDMLPALGMTEIPGLVEVESQTTASPQALGRGAGGRSMGLGKEEARMKPKLIKNPKTFEPLDLNFFIFGSAFEAGESSEEQDGRNIVSHQVEKLMQEKKKKEEEMEENKGSDIDLDLSLSQPGLVCKDKSSSSTSQNSCISADISLLFEASTLIVMGCINCHLYVMVSRQHLRCPKCNSCLLLDIFQPYSACN